MPLPKVEYPIHEVKLFSQNKPVKFRPFLVKEQKILMMAVESANIENVIDAVKQIINNCIIEEIDVDNLPLVDIELFFLNLRSRSMGEVVEVFFKCRNMIDGETECGMVINVGVNLIEEVQVINNTESNKIMFNNSVGVIMRYPTYEQIMRFQDSDNLRDRIIIGCMDQIFNEEEVYSVDEASEEEMQEFLEGLSSTDYEKLVKFVENCPKIQYKKTHNCPKCNFEHTMLLEGINDFFI